jgi:hypothetical protein
MISFKEASRRGWAKQELQGATDECKEDLTGGWRGLGCVVRTTHVLSFPSTVGGAPNEYVPCSVSCCPFLADARGATTKYRQRSGWYLKCC